MAAAGQQQWAAAVAAAGQQQWAAAVAAAGTTAVMAAAAAVAAAGTAAVAAAGPQALHTTRVCMDRTACGRQVQKQASPTTWQPCFSTSRCCCAGLFGSIDAPCFIFSASLSGNPKYTADAASHEVGHTLGLMHDGVKDASGATTNAYYTGHGDWAPIMVRVLCVGRQPVGFFVHADVWFSRQQTQPATLCLL